MRGVIGSLAAAAGLLLGGCATTAPPAAAPSFTAGVVQKQIHAGMSQAKVAEALGAPNIVSRDAEGRETWIYDRIAREASYRSSSAYGSVLVLGVGRESGSTSVTTRTLTVVIRFDGDAAVESFTFHSSTF